MQDVPIHFRKTRIAPTPSGFLHIGNLYAFSLTAAIAAKHNAKILLRIDDMDRERVQPRYIQDIFDTLRFMNIPWDEGPVDANDFERHFSQTHRLHLYQSALEKLRKQGLVYACCCTRSDLASHGEGYPGTCRNKNISLDSTEVSWRLDTSAVNKITVRSIDGSSADYDLPAEQKDFIVRRKNGSPSYQLCSLIDDEHFGIDLVVRGSDLWNSTLAQLFLASMLGNSAFLNTAFFHHPLIKAADGEKLSKSAGHTSIQELRNNFRSADEVYALMSELAGQPLMQSWRDLHNIP